MFKKQTRQRPLYVGDHVLALPKLGEIKQCLLSLCVCVSNGTKCYAMVVECWPEGARCPAVTTGATGDKLEVQIYTSQM